MKVLFDHILPFQLAHGGWQVQIEQTKVALEQIGVEVDFLRWWDGAQGGDIIHFFGRPDAGYVDLAHRKGMKVVLAELLTGMGSRSATARQAQRFLISLARSLLPRPFTNRLAWDSYKHVDAVIALTSFEAGLMEEMFGADPARVHVVPNGVEAVFFESSKVERGQWLVCTATIDPRKKVLELAEAAIEAETPLWVIGKGYSESDPYVRKFQDICAANPQLVRYEGAISDRARLAQIYREARAFVLLSSMESLSISALEAAASGCPLCLSDMPWARSVFGNEARYCPPNDGRLEMAKNLRRFYEEAPQIQTSFAPWHWRDVAEKLKTIYKSVLDSSAATLAR